LTFVLAFLGKVARRLEGGRAGGALLAGGRSPLRRSASVKTGEPGGGRGVVRAAGRGAVLLVAVPVWPWLAGSARLSGGPVTRFAFPLAGVVLPAGRHAA
jgi:hypothetical protein